MWGFGDGNLAAGRMRVALYGTLERVVGDEEVDKCHKAYLAGALQQRPCSVSLPRRGPL